MTSTIIKITPPVKEPAAFTFPGLFRVRNSGSLFIASSNRRSIRLYNGRIQMADFNLVGEATDYEITPQEFQQVTDSITLTLNP